MPFDPQDRSGIVYVWIGSKADSEEAKIAENIVKDMYDPERFSVQILNEGEEPNNFFWVGGEILIGISLINSSFKISNAPFFLIL